METETEVKTIQVNIKCPDCEITLINSGYSMLYQKYIQKCRRCGIVNYSDAEYPYIKYVKK